MAVWFRSSIEVQQAEAIEPLIPGLRRYARGWTRDASLADDLVQDALERALKGWQWRRRANPRSWLYAILHNVLVDHSRRQARSGTAVPVDTADQEVLPVAPQQEAAIHHRDLLAALDALPQEQRSAILLVSVEDLSYAEAAAVLSIPTGTLMSRISRGRDRLAEQLQDEKRSRLRRVK